MQFNLPSNLQNAVAAYDPEKKLQRRTASIAATSSTRKKPSFPRALYPGQEANLHHSTQSQRWRHVCTPDGLHSKQKVE